MTRARPILVVSCATLACAACADEPPAPAAADAVERILDRCLGPYRGRFAELALELRKTDGEQPTVVMVDARGRVRIQHPDGHTAVVTADAEGFGWVGGAADGCSPLEAAEIDACVALRELCQAMFLAPLENTVAERLDATTIRLASGWTLEAEGSRPLRLTSEQFGSVRFIELAQRAPTLPRVVELPGLGAQRVRLLGDSVRFDDSTFARPSAARSTEVPTIDLGPAAGPRVPAVEELPSARWLMIPDPGDWEQRVALCAQRGSALGRAGQRSAGDPLLVEDNRGAWLVVPFEPGDSGREFAPAADEVVRTDEGGPTVVVLAPPGTYDARIEAALELIQTFAKTHGHSPRGPHRVVINLHYEPGLTAGSEVERTMEIRLEQPITRR